MIFNDEKYPIGYATTQNELGNAFKMLAEIKDKDSNLENAIEAYDEAMVIFTEEKYPEKYRTVLSNQVDAQSQLKNNVSTVMQNN